MKTQKPLHVVIASRIFAPEPSAASTMLATIAAGFRDAGHSVTVLTSRPPEGIPIKDLSGITVKRARVLRDRQGYLRGYLPYMSFDIPLFFRMLFTRRADFYFVEPPPTTGAVVRIVTALLRRPYGYEAADLWSDAASMATSNRLVLSLLRAVERFALRGTECAFAISDGLISRMRELDIDSRAMTIGYGADAETFRYMDTPPPEAPYFVYAGSYSEWHGAGIFVDAFATFSLTHPEYRLIFVGNGSERDALSARCKELGLDSVEFRDPVPPEDLNPILLGATASLASLKPGQGYDYAFTTKLYSSIAAGCPVIFTGVGPTVSFIERTAEHFTGVAMEYDESHVVAALTAVAAQPFSPKQRRELSDWARENHSIQASAALVVSTAVDIVHKRL